MRRPIYRLVHDVAGDHFYTLSEAQAKSAIAGFGYRLEEVPAYFYLAP